MKILDVPQSGSLAGTTSSHNRYGQYRRTRAIPVNPNTPQQGVVRSRLSAYSAIWRTLDDGQRAGWEALALQISRSDSLGSSYTLNGFTAFISVNTTNVAAGNAAVDDAPALVTPASILTATVTLTAAAFSIAYTPTPLPADQRLFSFCSPQTSAGRSYWSDFRLIAVSAAAAASPANIFSAYSARLGNPAVGNRIFLHLSVYQGGFTSAPFITSTIVA